MVCGGQGVSMGCQGSGGVKTSPFCKRYGQLVIHQNPKLPGTVDLTWHNNILQYISGWSLIILEAHARGIVTINCTQLSKRVYGVFPLPDSYSETYSDTDSDSMQKCSTGTDSDGHSYGQFLWKLLKSHLIGTDIGAKMGTVPIGIGIGICIGIGVGSVETLLHITIVAIFYQYRNRNWNRAVETHH